LKAKDANATGAVPLYGEDRKCGTGSRSSFICGFG